MGALLREVFLPISSLPSFSVGAILFWKEFALRGALIFFPLRIDLFWEV